MLEQDHERPSVPRARLSLNRLSIKKRLPLLIGMLLVGVILACTLASYGAVRDSAREVSAERLRHLTQQLAGLFQQSASTLASKTSTVANDPAIRTYLRTHSTASRSEALAVLRQFTTPQETNSLQVELWQANHSVVLTLPENSSQIQTDLENEFAQTASSPSISRIGVIRPVRDSVAYPIVAAVQDEAGKPIGYLVRWRKLAGTPEARKQFLDLIGSHAGLYLGNNEGGVWTDLVRVVQQPPTEVESAGNVTRYDRAGESVAAMVRPVKGTPWLVMVEFPDQAVLAHTGRFLKRMTLVGLVLLAIGLASAWLLSRSITRPLHSLTEAASAISSGDYSRMVDVRAGDELGELAGAFNMMVVKVRDSQHDLEQKINERTHELELSNKELESFSYSVSHDLRAPLRAIDGFSRILREDHGIKLDASGLRILDVIRSNAQTMGRLIDDLLAFSRLGRKQIERSQIDMSELARDVFAQITPAVSAPPPQFNLSSLNPAHGDVVLVRQVLANLLSNAAKYSQAKKPAVIEVGGYSRNGEDVYFVRDNGVGFDMRYSDKLFGVFQRLHGPEEFEGTGVGLAIVQRIVHRHGGRVWAEGKVNEGATFYFTLPKETEVNGKPAKHE